MARSSVEVEFRALAHGIFEGMWINNILEEQKASPKTPIRVYYDNKAVIAITHNLVLHDRPKHIEVDKHSIKKKIDANVKCISCLSRTEQTANILNVLASWV